MPRRAQRFVPNPGSTPALCSMSPRFARKKSRKAAKPGALKINNVVFLRPDAPVDGKPFTKYTVKMICRGSGKLTLREKNSREDVVLTGVKPRFVVPARQYTKSAARRKDIRLQAARMERERSGSERSACASVAQVTSNESSRRKFPTEKNGHESKGC